VVRGEGPMFSSGMDLGALADLGSRPEALRPFRRACIEAWNIAEAMEKPVVAQLHGACIGGALELALACDLIVAKESARFGTPEINVGVFPFMIMALIYRNVPRKRANELLLLGERLSAEEAREAGIVNRVVPAEEFDAAVRAWAAKLAAKSPVMMKLGKDAIHRSMDMP
ncbi:MAG: enoyl-CoA hydratase/isomerase family protein, partial [Gemmatimonadaceae bacterium]